MICFDLRTTIRDSVGVSRWTSVARVSVSDDGAALVEDPDGLIDVRLGQYSLRQGRTVYFDQEPEEWARSLIATFNAPDLAPDVLADTNPWAVAETEDLAPRLAEGATTADDVPVAAAAVGA
jgi:hypothetical protein